MKNFVLSVLFASLSFAANAQDIELNEVISKINTSLNQAQNGLVGVTLTGASVTFETISAKTGGGGFKIFVKASKKWSKETTNSVTFNFSRPEKTGQKGGIEDQFAKIIMNAAEQYKKAIPVGTLVKDDFQVEIAFSLRKNTSGGIDFEIFGVEVEGSGELESTVFHKIALTFKSV